MKEETLEEAAESYDAKQTILDFGKPYTSTSRPYAKAFIDGAKWQQKNSYSEIEDFINWIDEEEIPREDGVWIKYFDGKDNYLTTKELFEQFKKKQIQSHNL